MIAVLLEVRRTYLYLQAAARASCLAFGFLAAAVGLRFLASRTARRDRRVAHRQGSEALLVVAAATAGYSLVFVVISYLSAHRVVDVLRRE